MYKEYEFEIKILNFTKILVFYWKTCCWIYKSGLINFKNNL